MLSSATRASTASRRPVRGLVSPIACSSRWLKARNLAAIASALCRS